MSDNIDRLPPRDFGVQDFSWGRPLPRASEEELRGYPQMTLLETRPDRLVLLSIAIGALNMFGIGILLIRGG